MTKAEFVKLVRDTLEAGGSSSSLREVERFLEALQGAVGFALKEVGEAPLPGLGKLVAEQRAARMGRNPSTGEAVEIPAKVVVKFRPSGGLAEFMQ